MDALKKRSSRFLLILGVLVLSFAGNPPETSRLRFPALTRKFYELNGMHLEWMQDDLLHQAKRMALINYIDSVVYLGLKPDRYHFQLLRKIGSGQAGNGITALESDQLFTDAAIALARDLKLGENICSTFSYDEISPAVNQAVDKGIPEMLLAAVESVSLTGCLNALEPAGEDYRILKRELAEQLSCGNSAKAGQLAIALNYLRWLRNSGLREYIVVSILPGVLDYYRNDTLALTMKIVAGKPATKTPRFAAHCDKVILYPYWNVPSSILPEFLPVIKRTRQILRVMNLEVIDKKGRMVDPERINWHLYNAHNFPYTLRQSTGCNNALGVIKFNLTSPYSVYLHDTNLKPVFGLSNRYFSHGCIRVEKPLELANYLTNNRVDSSFVAACLKQQEPVTINLERSVPVMVIYTPCTVDENGKVVYYRDIYNLL